MKLLFLILTLSITFSSCKQNENKVQSLSRNISSTDSSSTNTKVNSRLKKYYEDYLKRVLNKKQNNYNPLEGVIPDSITAVKIAEIILSKIYGEKNIIAEKPFSALLKDGYWIIYGFLPEGYMGGVAKIVIKKSNGEIINISHGK